ncbi:AraC family transcriptional regulator [Chryseobacterium phosphatilyticum]|uniref:AraC family transcriptional regulator n=1 Tax=Chryseobacterium phosphatilyticum TaxID=475075 RepID=A0A316XJX2_9FLAO|nr:AraC family transcriptional regulator [Chryseobacterium phosphatilyticum]PWN71150.1 AraC family transcriptional regulator [Chryseobacterium phosphatilyticum]
MRRSEEIVSQYFAFLEKHIQDVISGTTPEFMEVNEIAGKLAISHKHLTDTIKKETGKHPCYFYDAKIILEAKGMLITSGKSIAEIARILTYDPSNFSKFFKKMTGFTPGEFRISKKK